MGKRLDMSGGSRSGPSALRHVVRLLTILILLVGLAYLGVRYLKSLGSGPAISAGADTQEPGGTPRRIVDNVTGEVDVLIDTRLYPLPAGSDNAPGPPGPPADNAADVAAIVGLASVRDGATIERQPLYWLLREVEERWPADDLFMKRAPTVTLAQLRADPDRFRAQPVTIQGRIIRLEVSKLPENPSGVREVLDGDLLVGREGICMFLASRNPGVRPGHLVRVHGLFMKLVRYAGKGGRQEDAPLVVTSHPVLVTAEGEAPRTYSPHVLFGVLAALFVIYFVMMFVLRRRQQSRNALFEARRKARALTRGRQEVEREEEAEKP